MTSGKSYRAPSVARALKILELVAQSRNGLGISELARRLEISKGTVFGICNQLEERGALVRGPIGKNYALGPWLTSLSNRNQVYTRLRDVCGPRMTSLRDELNESVFMGVFTQNGITVLEARQPTGVIGISAGPGTRLPLTAGAVGKIFMAGLPDSEIDKILNQGIKPYTPYTICDPLELKRQLSLIRSQGYAVELDEYLMGLWACATSLGSETGLASALWSVGFTGNLGKHHLDEVTEALRKTAELIKEDLRKVL